MKSNNLPTLTLVTLTLILAVHSLPFDPATLFFGITEIHNGQAWRLLTGHLVHADWNHLAWNAIGLIVLGILIERRSRRLLFLALLAGTASVNLLLLHSGLDYYCGLSGVLNALLVVALWLEWKVSRSGWVIAVAIACAAKVILEISLGDSLISQISWPPYAWSHLAGMAGGVVAILLGDFRTQARKKFAF